MFWGISPAEDLVKIYEKYGKTKKRNDSTQTVTCLIIDGRDGRHVLETAAKKYRHKMVNALQFYVTDLCMESVARQLLLLQIAHEVTPPAQHVRTFMEVYGNALVRPLTAKIVRNVTEHLIDIVTCHQKTVILPFVDLTALKYRERDYLQRIFQFWNNAHQQFDLPQIWQMALRQRLGVRYDAKMGVFDWDLHMRLRPLGASQICNQEYRSFRRDGVAFQWLESELSYVNRTWAAGIVANGADKFLHFSGYYFGDVLATGPFCSWGLRCDDARYLKSTNGNNAFRATDVTERNLRQVFYELRQQREYAANNEEEGEKGRTLIQELGGAVFKSPDVLVVENHVSKGKSQKVAPSVGVQGVTVKFLSFDSIKRFDNNKMTDLFDVIWVSARALSSVNYDRLRAMARCLILVENPRFCPEFRLKQLDEMAKEVQKKFEKNDYEFFTNFNVENDNYMTFIKK